MTQKTLGRWIEYDCQACGKHCKRWVRPSYEHKPWKYCDRKCAGLGRVRQQIPCAYCGKLFHPVKQARYCSRECFALSTRGRDAHNAHPKRIVDYIVKHYPTSNPQVIADKLKMTLSAVRQVAYNHGLTLDREIKRQNIQAATAHHMKGSNNPNWQGGSTCKEWGSNWIEQRSAARKRDNRVCQVCGEQARSVHHIKPRRFFVGHMDDANVLSNLITLCAKHHLLVECGKIPCPTPKQ